MTARKSSNYWKIWRPPLLWLTSCVRVSTERQLVRFHLQAGQPCPLRHLCDAGWLTKCSVNLALRQITCPLIRWPSTHEPDFEHIAWKLTKPSALAPETIYWATRRAAELTGGIGGCLRQPLQVEHDLLVTETYLCRRDIDPATAQTWVGEDILRRDFPHLRMIPDALLTDDHGQPSCAIEIGGKYGAAKLRKFFRAFQHLALEVW